MSLLMPVQTWRRWLREPARWVGRPTLRAWGDGWAARRRYARILLELEELESRLTPSAPFVTSILRATPPGPVTAGPSVAYIVRFSEAVVGVDPTDFHLALTGTVAASSIQVTPVDPATYVVTVDGITGTGALGLNLMDDGSIRDTAGDRLYSPGAPASFQTVSSFNSGGTPTSVAVADLNGDGRPDLIFANGAAGTVSILLGNGDGTFQAPTTFAVGTNLTSVAVADVNGDGIPDIVVTDSGGGTSEGPGTVDVLLGMTGGAFSKPITSSAGPDPTSVAVKDLDGDGIPDLAVTNTSLGTVTILAGLGDGSFMQLFSLAAGINPVSVQIADLNHDGFQDLVVADAAGGAVDVILGGVDGSYQTPVAYAVGTDPASVTIADLNGDGVPDLVAANQGDNTVSVLLGNGDGTFGTQAVFAVGASPSSVAVADMNGDGVPDIVTTNLAGNTVSVLLGDGTGGFQSHTDFGAGTAPVDGVVADLNGDGRQDIVVADGAKTGGGVLLNSENGDFTGQLTTIDPSQVPSGVQLTLNAVAVAVNQPVLLSGVFTDPGTLDSFTVGIQWGDGSPDTVLALAPQTRNFTASHAYALEADYVATATVTDSGDDSAVGAALVPVIPAPFGPTAVAVALPGQTATGAGADPLTGASVGAAQTLAAADLAPAEFLVTELTPATLPLLQNVAPGNAGLLLLALDIREFGATPLDSAVATFRIPTSLENGAPLLLQWLNPATGRLEAFVPDNLPGSLQLNVVDGFIVGRIVFDNATTPRLTQLTSTVFTVSLAAPSPAAAAAVAVSTAQASSNPAATAPLQTASFQSTSQLTLTLAASQAGQASAGLLSLNTISNSGGETTADPVDAAWIQFVVQEYGDDPRYVWQYGGEAAIRLWAQKQGRPVSPTPAVAAPPPPPQSVPAETPGSQPEGRRAPPAGNTPPAGRPKAARGASGLPATAPFGWAASLIGLAPQFLRRTRRTKRGSANRG